MSKIPEEILSEFCEIVNGFDIDGKIPELTLADTRPAQKTRSFLNPTTISTGTLLLSEEGISDVQDNFPDSISHNFSQR